MSGEGSLALEDGAEHLAGTASDSGPASDSESAPDDGGFHVHLSNFSGPFDLLLSLIAKHKLDITEIALAQVTDEFISYIRTAFSAPEHGDALGGGDSSKNLGEASEFLVVAATLLDLKAARLLPHTDIDTEDAFELLEARDLLFAKLLQYRAFKELAAVFEVRMLRQATYVPRSVSLEPRFAAALPPLVWNLDADALKNLAQVAFGLQPTPAPPQVRVTHLHAPRITMADEIEHMLTHLRAHPRTTFTALTADTTDVLTVVVRFLILLELYRDQVLSFSQTEPLDELQLRFEAVEGYVPRFFDEYDGTAGT